MYFVISAGGTAGHINPAIAVADELREQGHDILFAGTPDHREAQIATQAGFEFVGFSVSGFDKAHPLSLVSSGVKILRATGQAKRLFGERRPDAVATFGAYVSVPVGRAAAAMSIPLIVHEQNSVPGMANVYLAPRADVTALAYESCAQHLDPKTPAIVTGNPVRRSFEQASRTRGRKRLGIPDYAPVLLVLGGSLGAQHVNSAICALKKRLLGVEDAHVVLSTGPADYERVLSELSLTQRQQARFHVFPYIEDMGDVLAACDVVVSRAGASSLAEITALGVPAILVPYPYARADHQTHNARACVDAGAAVLVADADVESAAFGKLVVELLGDPKRRATMSAASRELSGADARGHVAELIVSAAQAGQRG